jgi:signal transduction histidine kinase
MLSGTLLNALRHEVNNMLLRIAGNLQRLEHEPSAAAARAVATETRAAGDALTQVLQALVALADDVPAPPRCNAEDLIQTVLRLVAPLANERHIRIVPHTTPTLVLPLPLHEAQHFLLHLIINSVEAIPLKDDQQHTIWINIVAWDAVIVITVRDTGPGVPPAIRPQIFDPLVSSKPTTAGRGLGLTVVRSILQRAGGNIALTDTRPGHTTFTAWLPRPS